MDITYLAQCSQIQPSITQQHAPNITHEKQQCIMSIETPYVLTSTIDLGIGWLNAYTGTKDCTLARTRQTARIQRESRMDKPARQHATKVHTTTQNLPSFQLNYQNCSKIQSPTRIILGISCKPKAFSYKDNLAKAPS
jgi:hypothetical protein